MDNFKIIYKILKHLEASLDCEITDMAAISPERLRTTYIRWEQLLIMMQNSGYIDGIKITKTLSDNKWHIIEPVTPSITLCGLEYLADNSFMKKAADLLRGAVETVGGFHV